MPIIAAIVLGLLSLVADIYIYRVVVKRVHSALLKWTHVAVAACFYVMVVVALLLPYRTGSDSLLIAVNWMFFIFLSVYLSKYLFIIFDLLASLPKLWRHRRMSWLSGVGAGLAVVMFALMWWGALFNRFNLDVKELTIEVPELPQAFNGYRILQLSDMHLGSYFGDTSFVEKIVDEINVLKPDVVVFTGDIVNRRSSEMLPFVEALSRVEAPVYAILGNHDYGDYTSWASPEAKQANMQELYAAYQRTGWHLLRNEHVMLHNGNDSIALIGVENIGDPPFHIYGDLVKSYPNLSDSVTKILLSHNPAHWVADIRDNTADNIALTLSGHTHAMQIELFGLSPAVFRYPTWGGLYQSADSRRQLYVNIGVGTVGMLARVGATPELTLFTLKRPHKP